MIDSKYLKKLAYRNMGLFLFGAFVSNNIITLKMVEDDAMAPVLNNAPTFRDIAIVLRATRYHKNDVILYKNPNTGSETFGRITSFNTSDDIGSFSSKIPSGHCWIEKYNPRSDQDDSHNFGPIPLGLVRGYVLATVFPPSRAKLMIA